jgi:hypothetical protein
VQLGCYRALWLQCALQQAYLQGGGGARRLQALQAQALGVVDRQLLGRLGVGGSVGRWVGGSGGRWVAARRSSSWLEERRRREKGEGRREKGEGKKGEGRRTDGEKERREQGAGTREKRGERNEESSG